MTLVDLDPRVLELAKTSDHFTDFNEDSLDDPRVTTIAADAFTWLREAKHTAYDAVIADLPDPDDVATSKLYSIEFYGLIRQVMAPGARLVVQAGSPYFDPEAYWGIGEAVAEAGLTTTPYHVDVPSFGDWGFHLARPAAEGAPVPALDAPAGLRFLTPDLLQAALVFPADRPALKLPYSTLDKPVILDYAQTEWQGY